MTKITDEEIAESRRVLARIGYMLGGSQLQFLLRLLDEWEKMKNQRSLMASIEVRCQRSEKKVESQQRELKLAWASASKFEADREYNAEIAEKQQREIERLRNPPQVGGVHTEKTLADLAHAAQIFIGEEQEKPNCDTALIAVLCDTVRLTREAVPEVGLRADMAKVEAEVKRLRDEVTTLRKLVGEEWLLLQLTSC